MYLAKHCMLFTCEYYYILLIFTHLRFIKAVASDQHRDANNIKMIKGVHQLTLRPNTLISLIDHFTIFNGWMFGQLGGPMRGSRIFVQAQRPEYCFFTGSEHGTNTYVRTYAYMHSSVHTRTHARTHTHTRVHTYIRTYVRTYARTHAHTHTYMRMYRQAHECSCTGRRRHTCT